MDSVVARTRTRHSECLLCYSEYSIRHCTAASYSPAIERYHQSDGLVVFVFSTTVCWPRLRLASVPFCLADVHNCRIYEHAIAILIVNTSFSHTIRRLRADGLNGHDTQTHKRTRIISHTNIAFVCVRVPLRLPVRVFCVFES